MTANKTANLARIAEKVGQFGKKARIRPISSVTSLCLVGYFATTLSGYCIERSESTVRTSVTQWMKGHPVMGTQPRSITKVEVLPNAATPGAVAVVSLSPQGTVVLNRDTRLPMIVMFTPNDTIKVGKDYVEPAKHAARMLESLGANQPYVGETSTIQNGMPFTPDPNAKKKFTGSFNDLNFRFFSRSLRKKELGATVSKRSVCLYCPATFL